MARSKFNIVATMQRWMDSVPGQTFLNYAYSWGASIVILGTLFKLTHIAGANFMLFLGMGTEVLVFFLSAFDRPFDKTEEGRELPIHLDEVEKEEMETTSDEKSEDEGENFVLAGKPRPSTTTATPRQGGTAIPTGTVYVTSGVINTGSTGTPQPAAAQPATGINQSNAFNAANNELLQHAQGTLSPEMEEATQAYVDELKKLTDTLSKVSEQSVRLTRDSEEMEQLNRTLTGINTIYEMQLKSISTQVGTIDQINDQTRRMAQQIEELNGVYSRMIKALTVNMKNAATGAVATEE